MLGEYKFSKYLLYAIGEIFLVVVGILIALQINNWNEANKNRQLQLNYVRGLISDLEYDINAFSGSINELDDHRESADALLTCYKEQSSLPEEELMAHFVNVGLIARFSHRNTVMEDMQSAGRLHLIMSDSVRQEIISYYKMAGSVIEGNDNNNTWILDKIIGSRIYTEQFDFNSTVAASKKLPPIMKSVEVNSFTGLPYLHDIGHPDRDNIVNLLTAKNWLEGLNKFYALQGRDSAQSLKELLEAYLEEIE